MEELIKAICVASGAFNVALVFAVNEEPPWRATATIDDSLTINCTGSDPHSVLMGLARNIRYYREGSEPSE